MVGRNDTGFNFCSERFQGQFSRSRHSSYALFLERASVRVRATAGAVARHVFLFRIGFVDHGGVAGEGHDNLWEEPSVGVAEKVFPARHLGRGESDFESGSRCGLGTGVGEFQGNGKRNADRVVFLSRSQGYRFFSSRSALYRGASDRMGSVVAMEVVVAKAVVGAGSGSRMGE